MGLVNLGCSYIICYGYLLWVINPVTTSWRIPRPIGGYTKKNNYKVGKIMSFLPPMTGHGKFIPPLKMVIWIDDWGTWHCSTHTINPPTISLVAAVRSSASPNRLILLLSAQARVPVGHLSARCCLRSPLCYVCWFIMPSIYSNYNPMFFVYS